VSEAASILSVSTETVRRYIKSGKLEGKKDHNMWLVKLDDVSQSEPHVTDSTVMDVVRLESKVGLLEQHNQMLQNQINMQKERIRELETDKGFLLTQIEEKDKVISELMPRALPKPKMNLGERIRKLFRRQETGQTLTYQ